MLNTRNFLELLRDNGFTFFTGVPDSLLKELCSCIMDLYPASDNVITANEGAAVALAGGYHLATGNCAVVYMQNSGTGNAVNPLLSLCDPDVYAIPMLLIIGWRGEPGVHDEPQHVKQGRVQQKIMEAMELPYEILSDDPSCAAEQVERLSEIMLEKSKPVALLVRKNTFAKYEGEGTPSPDLEMSREKALEIILDKVTEEDKIVSTTGKTSREIYEIREARSMGHKNDFLTVGSMGHTGMIALGLARSLEKISERNIYCIDGDGAALMHMGSMAIIANQAPENLIHLVLNNGAHDSVGGQPTIGFDISFANIAHAMGYEYTKTVDSEDELSKTLDELKSKKGPILLEVLVRKGSRSDLGRPKTTPVKNKQLLMDNLYGNQRLFAGNSSLVRLYDFLSDSNAKKIMVFHGRESYKNSGINKIIEKNESAAEILFVENIPKNPEFDFVKTIAQKYNTFKPDTIIAVGGGSVLDTAKSTLVLAGGSSEQDILSNNFLLPDSIPLFIAVPTTAGSGSEATHFAVIYKDGKKYSLANKSIRPDTVVLSAKAGVSCPESVTLSSGIDAVCQSIESFWNKNANEISRSYCLRALSLILPSIVLSIEKPKDIKTRENMLKGAHLAGQAINITKTTAGHALSYSLTTRYGIPHGLAVMLVMEQLLPLMEKKYLWNSEELDQLMSRYSWGGNLIEGFSAICDFIKKHVEIELKEKDISSAIENLSTSVNLERLSNHPVILEIEDIKRIYKNILENTSKF